MNLHSKDANFTVLSDGSLVPINRYLEAGAICRKCHDLDEIICVYCVCPLYQEDCGGEFVTLASGVKDCSECIRPHTREFVELRLERFGSVDA